MRTRHPHSALNEARAQGMRRAPTASEAALWRALSGGKLGTRFRRQAVLGRYIVDFVAPRERLVVEVDGGYHAARVAADARRDRALARIGYRVVRVSDEAVLRRMPEALAAIMEALLTPP